MSSSISSDFERTLSIIKSQKVFTRNELLSRSKADSAIVDSILKRSIDESTIVRLQEQVYALVKNINVEEQTQRMADMIAKQELLFKSYESQIEQQKKSAQAIFDEIEKSVKE